MEELEAFSIEDLVTEVKNKILHRSSGGIKGIARIFRAMDDNGNRQLDVEDFRWGFIDYGFNLSQEEAQHLVNHFDRDGNGTVSYDEFLRALKGELSEARKVWIRAAYAKLDVNQDGQVTLADIAAIYDASEHPEVKEGKKTPDQVF
jgi:Ca2+-binding EF-hand superfamily protein